MCTCYSSIVSDSETICLTLAFLIHCCSERMNESTRPSTPERYIDTNLFRFSAVVLEWLPIFFSALFLVKGYRWGFMLGMYVLTIVYIFLSWYLFRAAEVRGLDVMVSFAAGLLLGFNCQGILFNVLQWPHAEPMGTLAMVAAAVGTVASLILGGLRTLVSRHRLMELRMYWKLLSRFLAALLILRFYLY